MHRSSACAQQWFLECLDGPTSCTLTHPQLLRIGRTVQPLSLWEKLVPVEKHRNTISREHCDIRVDAGNQFTLINKSTFGTTLNGSMVNSEVQLKDGDIIGIGNKGPPDAASIVTLLRFRFTIGTPPPGTTAQHPACSAVQVAPMPTGALGTQPIGTATLSSLSRQLCICRLKCMHAAGRRDEEFKQSPNSAHVISSEESGLPLRVGRTVQPTFWNELVLDEKERTKVSREHFEIIADDSGHPEQVFLVNLSNAGTLLNGTRTFQKVRLQSGDIVAVPSSASAESREPEPVASFVVNIAQQSRTATPAAQVPAATLGSRAAIHTAQLPAVAPCLSMTSSQVKQSFRLQCVSALGLSAAELGFLPSTSTELAPNPGQSVLRIGRTIQPATFWERLVPNEKLRNTISREQIEITEESGAAAGAGQVMFYIANIGNMRSLVNGKKIHARTRLESMDTIGIGTSIADENLPVIQFRFIPYSSNKPV